MEDLCILSELYSLSFLCKFTAEGESCFSQYAIHKLYKEVDQMGERLCNTWYPVL